MKIKIFIPIIGIYIGAKYFAQQMAPRNDYRMQYRKKIQALPLVVILSLTDNYNTPYIDVNRI